MYLRHKFYNPCMIAVDKNLTIYSCERAKTRKRSTLNARSKKN